MAQTILLTVVGILLPTRLTLLLARDRGQPLSGLTLLLKNEHWTCLFGSGRFALATDTTSLLSSHQPDLPLSFHQSDLMNFQLFSRHDITLGVFDVMKRFVAGRDGVVTEGTLPNCKDGRGRRVETRVGSRVLCVQRAGKPGEFLIQIVFQHPSWDGKG